MPKEKINKTNACRILDAKGIAYELIPYEVDENDLGAQHIAEQLGEDIDQVANMMNRVPTLYDDIYMDLTFVGVFDRLGIDAPLDSLANAFAHEGYALWHANQAARYNILRGIKAPMSGHWKNNPHADDIDYQIEADYAGIMSPGMPNTASKISDKVGHIMNYGNGWYGGVYVGAMYALAFVTDDIDFIVKEGL